MGCELPGTLGLRNRSGMMRSRVGSHCGLAVTISSLPQHLASENLVSAWGPLGCQAECSTPHFISKDTGIGGLQCTAPDTVPSTRRTRAKRQESGRSLVPEIGCALIIVSTFSFSSLQLPSTYWIYVTCQVVPCASHIFIHLILTTSLWGG